MIREIRECAGVVWACGPKVYMPLPFMSDGLVTLSFEPLHLDLYLLEGVTCSAANFGEVMNNRATIPVHSVFHGFPKYDSDLQFYLIHSVQCQPVI